MTEARSTATILALADLADLSANQLEEGRSVEDVISLLRKAADAVRETVDLSESADPIADDLLPIEIDCDIDTPSDQETPASA